MALNRSSFDASSIMTPNDQIVNEIGKESMAKQPATNNDEKRASRLMWLFMFNVCAVAMGHVVLSVYTNGVIRTLERRFGLSSSKSGLLSSCNDIIHICLVIFIGYFGQKYNKPRIICVTIMFSAIAGIMMASPHVLFSDYDDTYSLRRNINTSENGRMHYKTVNNFTRELKVMTEDFTSIPNNVYSVEHVFSTSSPKPDKPIHANKKTSEPNNIQYCSKTEMDSYDIENGNCKDIKQDRVHPAFYIFVVAQLISGTGSSGAFTLSMAYLDENSPKHKASLYIGAFMSLFSFGPVTGFMLATLCLKFPENLLSGSSVDSTDPSFIGCWWLGYLIGGIYVAIFAIPLWWYPKKISFENADPESNVEKVSLITNEAEEGLLEQLKGIPKAFAGLMSNKLFLINVCQIICGAYTIYSVFVNLVRYIEIHFNRTAAEGSVIAGVVTAITGAAGNIGGGALVSKFKMRAIDGIRLVLFSSAVFASGNLILMNLACPQVEMNMNYDPKFEMNTVLNDCNKPCLCTTNRVDYRPICASNNVSYFSPCVAGCSESVNGTFTDCKCLNNVTTPNEYIEGTARRGYCIPPCNLLIPFALTLFVMSFCSSISRVPATMISFRIVKDEERSFALGINSFAINLFGFVPSPLLFGYLIDKSCILWQVTCKTIGACLMFDVARFRYSIFGSGFVIELINFSLNFTLFLFLRKMTLGTALLSRKKDEICQVEINHKEEENNRATEDGLKAIEMDKMKTNDNGVTQLTKL